MSKSAEDREFEYRANIGLLMNTSYALATRVRRKVFNLFMQQFSPTPGSRVADLGVTANKGNPVHYFFETLYPYKNNLTAIGRENAYWYPEIFSGMTYINADLRSIPLPDDFFDYGICNAVIEHAGQRESQIALIKEICRVCKCVMVITPNANFFIDPHTFIPVAHLLPTPMYHAILRFFGLDRFANIEMFNPLTASSLLDLFPRSRDNRLFKIGFPLLKTNIACVSRKTDNS